MDLLSFMAKACVYAQQHIDDKDAWDISKDYREMLLQCVSYQMACFLAQNTEYGKEGVEWEVVLEELTEHPGKSEKEWALTLNEKALVYGGWSPNSGE